MVRIIDLNKTLPCWASWGNGHELEPHIRRYHGMWEHVVVLRVELSCFTDLGYWLWITRPLQRHTDTVFLWKFGTGVDVQENEEVHELNPRPYICETEVLPLRHPIYADNAAPLNGKLGSADHHPLLAIRSFQCLLFICLKDSSKTKHFFYYLEDGDFSYITRSCRSDVLL